MIIYKCCIIFRNLLSAWSVAVALVFHAPHLPGSCRRVARFLGGCANHWGNHLKSAKNIEQMWKVSKNIQDGQPLFWPLQFSIFQLPLFLLDALDTFARVLPSSWQKKGPTKRGTGPSKGYDEQLAHKNSAKYKIRGKQQSLHCLWRTIHYIIIRLSLDYH